MREAVNRGQGTVNSSGQVVRRCDVSGCNNRAWEGERFCARCTDEIQALHATYAQGQRFAAICQRVKGLLWVPLLGFVGLSFAYLLFTFGEVLYEWWVIEGGIQ
jgi:hypothetical protein